MKTVLWTAFFIAVILIICWEYLTMSRLEIIMLNFISVAFWSVVYLLAARFG